MPSCDTLVWVFLNTLIWVFANTLVWVFINTLIWVLVDTFVWVLIAPNGYLTTKVRNKSETQSQIPNFFTVVYPFADTARILRAESSLLPVKI